MVRKIVLSFVFVFFISLNADCYIEEQLSFLERNNYGQSFANDSLSERLNRLEMDVLGMRQSGDVDERVSLLTKMSQGNISTPSFDYYKPTKRSAIQSILNNVGSVFSNDDGFMTGYTPPMGFSYGNNMNNYHYTQPRYCPYHNVYHSRPSRFHHHYPNRIGYNPYGPNYERPTYGYTNTMTGSSVHILRDWFYTIKKRTLISSLFLFDVCIWKLRFEYVAKKRCFSCFFYSFSKHSLVFCTSTSDSSW